MSAVYVCLCLLPYTLMEAFQKKALNEVKLFPVVGTQNSDPGTNDTLSIPQIKLLYCFSSADAIVCRSINASLVPVGCVIFDCQPRA